MSTIVVNVYNTEATVNVSNEVISIHVNLAETKVPLNIHYGISEEQVLELLTKENIEGLKTTDSPEFLDVVIPSLKSDNSGGLIPQIIYAWFKGLFPALVDGSVKSYIIGLLTVVKDLATRVGLLEDSYLLKYVVPVNTNYIDLTLDKNGNAINIAEGETFEIIIPIRKWVNPLGTSRINLRFNGITSSIYRVGNTGLLSHMITQGSYYYNNDVRVKLTLAGGNLHGHTMAYQESPQGTFVAGIPQMYGCRTDGYSFSAINRIELLVANANEIPAGVVILLKKI